MSEKNSIALQTFDGITDSAASEYFAENTASIKAVQQYADGAFDAYLNDDLAAMVLRAAKKWREYDGDEGQNFLDKLRADIENAAEERR